MSLDEFARLIPEMARKVELDHLPFLEAADQVIAGMVEITKSIEDPKAADLMRQMIAEVNDSRSEFLCVVPTELQRMRAEIIQNADDSAASMLEFQKTYAEGMASLGEMQASVPARLEAARAEMLASIPKPPPAPEPISINPGEELVARLMELGRPKPIPRATNTITPPSSDRPSGFVARLSTSKIWDNWKPDSGAS